MAPIPKPAPVLAEPPIDGTYISRMAKVAAAVRAINKTSSSFGFFLGMPHVIYIVYRWYSTFYSLKIPSNTYISHQLSIDRSNFIF